MSNATSKNRPGSLKPAGRFFATLLAAALILPASARGQSDQQRAEEAADYYSKWLREDVVYIIDPAEQEVFLKLTTPEEKDQFIEQFWRRRDPDPTTAQNEFKEEHYRRIAYANEHYHSGVPGWKTDRGMIYIKFGPPQGITKQPEGGFYSRKGKEGGGFTSTFPFEIWFYNSLPGVGDGIEIEFVDSTRTNEYRIARDPDEKDALITVPGAGLTDAEAFGSQTRLSRIILRGLGNQDSLGTYSIDRTFQSLSSRDFPLQRLETLYNLQKAPGQEFKDLQKIVDVRLSYGELPFEIRIDTLQITPQLALVPVTVFFDNRDLTYKSNDGGVSEAVVEIFGRLDTLAGRTEYAFEDSVRHVQGGKTDSPQAVYQKRFPLAPGRYKLSLALKDEHSGRVSTVERLIAVANRGSDEEPYASSVILTPRVEPVPDGGSVGDPFVLTKYRVRPIEKARFKVEDRFVQSYFEVYNLAVDSATGRPEVQIEISLTYQADGEKSPREVFPWTVLPNEFELDGDRLLVYKTIPFQGLVEGRYRLLFRVTDKVSGKTVDAAADFAIEAASESAG